MGIKVVNVLHDGKKISFNTDKEILKDALAEKDISIADDDFIEPNLDTELKLGDNEVTIRKPVPVTVIDDGKVIIGRSARFSAPDILKDLSINLHANDEISVANPLEEVTLGLKIYIDRAPVVNLQVDGRLSEIHTRLESVSDLLYSEDIVLGKSDRVEPALNTKIYDGLIVKVIRVIESENAEVVDIPFSVQYKESYDLLQGETRVERYGEIGKKEVAFKKTTENGVEINRQILSEKILKEPIDQIIIKGKRPQITYVSGSYSDLINDAARKYSVDAGRMQRMMMCESGGNANSVGGGGRFHGLFQYLPSTWARASAGAGYAGADIYNPQAQIYTTAWKISVSGYGAWPICGRK